MSATLTLAVEVDAPAAVTWGVVTDWDRQGEWMLATRVRGTPPGQRGVGGRIEAFTGLGPVGFLDRMEITEWDPPRRCVVRHVGRVVRGNGIFEVEPLPRERSRFVLTERLDLPLGPLGRAGWLLVRPVVEAGVLRSLARLAAQVAAQGAAQGAAPGTGQRRRGQ